MNMSTMSEPPTQVDTSPENGQTPGESSDDSSAVLEGKEPPPNDVVYLCRETFQRTAEYFKGEMEGTIDDYKLLEMMNKITMSKYTDMKSMAATISSSLQELNDKYKQLQPYFDQIDQIEENVNTLEQMAYKLDAYSKRLEQKFKMLEKR